MRPEATLPRGVYEPAAHGLFYSASLPGLGSSAALPRVEEPAFRSSL